MNNRNRLLILIPSVILLGLFLWFFRSIIIYVLLAAIVSLIGRPLMKLLAKVKLGKFVLPDWLSAAITLVTVYGSIVLIFVLLIPIIGKQANTIAKLAEDNNLILERLQEPLDWIQQMVNKYQMMDPKGFQAYVQENLQEFLGSIKISNIFSSLGGFVGNLFIAIFSVAFISFFLLKENRLLNSIILTITPSGYEDQIQTILSKIKPLLTRYVIGVVIEVLLVGSLISIGLSILGVQNAIFIGFFAGTLNVVPYLGPIIGAMLGLALTLLGSLDLEFYTQIVPLLSKAALVFIIVQLIDNFFFQPLIYSSSVKAHPLEIFLVILMAGSLAGVVGMILAIPVYTIFRVVAKEFLSGFKIIESLTRNI